MNARNRDRPPRTARRRAPSFRRGWRCSGRCCSSSTWRAASSAWPVVGWSSVAPTRRSPSWGLLCPGVLWWLCRRGRRSSRFCRMVDVGGLLLVAIVGSFLTRYILVAFVREHALVTAEGSGDGGCLRGHDRPVPGRDVPGDPRGPDSVIPSPHDPFDQLGRDPEDRLVQRPGAGRGGGLAWRSANSGVFPWLPTTSIMEWTIATITCTVISRVIYGLRAEVREARRFGQYVLERKIGEGAMGVVYRATHAMLRRPAAIKLLLKDRASEADLARFEREVQHTSHLVHPNTISIFDYGRTADGTFYYVMEYLDGIDLQRLVDRIRTRSIPPRDPHPRPDQRRARRGPRARPDPPRHQAGKHRPHRAPRRARRRQGGRLRSRQEVRRRAGRVDGHRCHHRHAAVHGS